MEKDKETDKEVNITQQQCSPPPPNNNQKECNNDSNILVAIRVRPLNQKEINISDWDIIRIEDNLIVVLDPVEMEFVSENKKMLEVYHRSKEQRYAFDKIFREHSQEEIYQQTCKHLIKPVMQGYNATVFAYGPTGTGKTYTMLGNSDVPGLSALTITDIFEYIKHDAENDYDVRITYVEIYNESIRDLLVPHSAYLELRDDPIKGITISGVTEYKAESTEQVMNLLFLGNKRRTTEATNANLTSSRSHAVFQILVNSTSRFKNTEIETLTGKLSLIDLAGSERGTVTENRGLRLREGAKINQSLLALANCINALGEKSKKGFFVPYRDSKLTRMLKDSLGGNCKTVMIANISPASGQFEETINTLKYANRAKNIKTKGLANKRLVAMHIAEYKNIINDLRSEIEQLKAKLHSQINDNGESLTYNEDPPIEQNVNQKLLQQQCICGRAEEEEEMKKIQEEIFENFQDRIQLRRALMEVEEQNAMNILEIKKRQTDILVWKRNEGSSVPQNLNNPVEENPSLANVNSSSTAAVGEEQKKMNKPVVPEEIKQHMKYIRTLKMNTEKNRIKKELMNLQLMENIANAKKIRDRIPKRIKFKDKRNFLELVIKNHVLELQNIELEINLQIQEKTIQDLKNIIDSQKKIIHENNLDQVRLLGGGNGDENANINNNNNLLSNNSNEEIEVDLEELVYDEEFADEGNQNELDDEEDMNEIEIIKEMIEKNNIGEGAKKVDSNNGGGSKEVQIADNKRPSKNELLPEIGQHKQRDRSALSNKHQAKLSQEKLELFKDRDKDKPFNQNDANKEIMQINGTAICNNNNNIDQKEISSFIDYQEDEGGSTTPKYSKNSNGKDPVKKKKKRNANLQNSHNQGPQNFNSISITGQQALTNFNNNNANLNVNGVNTTNINSNKGMPSITKQTINQKEKDLDNIRERQKEKDKEKDNRDFSGLNLKGLNDNKVVNSNIPTKKKRQGMQQQ